MTRLALAISTTALMCVGVILPTAVEAQQKTLKDDLAGTWVLQSDTNEKDGKKIDPFGPNPYGYFIFGPDGHFSISLVRRDMPKFASNNRNTGTTDENKAVVQGSINYFGTDAVNADKSLSLHIIASTFPNWDGVDQNRAVQITGDQLKWTVPTPAVGGTAMAILERAKPAGAARQESGTGR